jgi:L-lactate dehydrogenase (cytochrome)
MSLRTNRRAFEAWRFLTRVLVGVGDRSQRTTVFGREYEGPFGIAPMGASAVVAYDGDLVMGRAAAASGIPFVLSASSIIPMEEVTAQVPGAWFAAYQSPDRQNIEAMVERITRAKFDVLVITADVPVGSNRENDKRSGFSLPLRPSFQLAWDGMCHPRWTFGTALPTLLKRGIPHMENLEPGRGPSLFSKHVSGLGAHDRLSWEHIRLIRNLWKGPLVVKGVLSPQDARIAEDCGVDGIIISNHGGRQLDSAATPLQILPEIVDAVPGLTVMIDSGFRRGGDVLKALALGARFVFIGRPFLFAAALAGEPGVLHAIALLAREIDIDQALLGLPRLADAQPDMLLASKAMVV